MNKVRPIYIYICLTVVILAGAAFFAFKPFTAVAADTHDHSGWEQWTDPTKLPTDDGSYYLDTNVTLSMRWQPSANITLCLNGHTIGNNGSYPTIEVKSGGTLDIYDCDGSGTVTNGSDYTLQINDGGTANIYGGKFINNNSWDTIRNDGGTLTMSGGEITYTNDGNGINNSGNAHIKNVKIIYVGNRNGDDSGIYCIGGGTITVESCEIESGTGVCVYVYYGTAKIIGGTFNGIRGIYNDDKIELSGSPTFSCSEADIFLVTNRKITVTGPLDNTTPYSVRTQTKPTEGNPVVFTDSSETSNNDATKFKAAEDGYIVRKNDNGQLELVKPAVHTHDGITFEPWTSTTSLPDTAGSYYLYDDVTLSGWLDTSANLNLCLNGHTINTTSSGPSVIVRFGGILNIYDCQVKGEVKNSKNNCININVGGTANIYGGIFNSNSTAYPAINVEGTVTIENASVSSGSNAVSIQSGGTANIYGGTFVSTSNPTISAVANASLKIIDGTFIRNNGGAVIQNQGTLEMSGGTVTGKSTSTSGAVGILNYGASATATIENVTITTVGTATDDDADKGLRNDNGGTMTVENCDINSSNWAVWNTITPENGSRPTIKISGGTFKGRYGIYNNNGKFELSGSPTFTGSTADIYLSDGQKITVTGTLGNTAPYSVLTATDPTVGNPVEITDSSNTSYNNADKFTPANNRYILRKNSSEQLELALLAAYTITYDKGTGSDITGSHNADTVTEGESVTLPGSVFTRTGYTQTGWATSDGGAKVYELNETFTPDSSITLYPYWTANTYTATFNANGGGWSGEQTQTIVQTYDLAWQLPSSDPTREGYAFAGWWTAVTGGTQVKSVEIYQIDGETILYAHWSAGEYTVTFDYQGADGGDSYDSKSVVFGETYGVLPKPTKTGELFVGWFTESGKQIKSEDMVEITANITLYAHWTLCDHSNNNWVADSYEYDDTVSTEKHTHICGDCGEAVEENHQYGNWIDDRDGANHSRTCIYCGRIDQQEHNWNEGTFTLGNCTTRSQTDFECLSCGAEKTEYGEIVSDVHNWVDSGYDEQGHHLRCQRCGETEISDHIWDEGTVDFEPTCVSKGRLTQHCTVSGCSETKTVDIDINPNSHKWSTEWQSDESGHWHICENGCGQTYSAGHTWGNGVPTLEATCTTAGEETVTCTDCGYSKTETTNPKGHDFSGEWKSDVNGHWHECSRDSVKSEIIPHTEKEVITTPATSTTEGLKTYICDDCGYEIRTEVIPATGESGNITVDSESGANAPAVSMDASTTSRLEAEVYAEHTTPEERAAIDNGSNLDVILRVEDAGGTVPANDKQAAEAVIAGANYTLGQYLNIDMLKFIDGQEAGKITKLSSPISVTIEVPENMRNANRTFVIVRIHDGIADTLRDIDNDPNTITIMTDRFSTYAIAYQDGQQGGGSGGQNSGTVTPGNPWYPSSVPTNNSSSDSNDKSEDSNSNTDDVSSAAGLYGENDLLAEGNTAPTADMFIPVGIVLVSMMFIIRKRSKENK